MDIKLEHPPEYMEGAYKITAKLDPTEIAVYQKFPLAFKIPVLSKRLIHTESEYIVACTDEEGTYLRGRFKEGIWITHVYTNGIEEKKNPTPIENVVVAIEKEIIEILDKL
jgi:hypothetical protein